MQTMKNRLNLKDILEEYTNVMQCNKCNVRDNKQAEHE